MMEQKGKVLRWEKGMAQVEIIRNSACSGSCSGCGGCSSGQRKIILEVKHSAPLQVGQVVRLCTKTGKIMLLTQLTYIAPVALFIFGYFVGGTKSEDIGILSAFGGLLLSAPILFLANKMSQNVLKNHTKILP